VRGVTGVPTPAATTVVVPACDDAATIGAVVEGLRAAAPWRDVLVIDDGSTDGTAKAAAAAGARVVRHPHRKGSGAAVKSGIREARGDFVLILDRDGRCPPAEARHLTSLLDGFDLVVGVRPAGDEPSPLRRLARAFLDRLASYLAEQRVADLTSPIRAARREPLLEIVHLLPDGFSSGTTTTMAFIRAGYSVRFEGLAPAQRGRGVPAAAADRAPFLATLLRVITVYSPLRVFLPLSLGAFALGAAYAVWTIGTQSHVTNSSVVLILLGVVILLVGLVSEQVSSLLFEARPR
jgi:glycosyltransferase involved in cell wall biosynthesis